MFKEAWLFCAMSISKSMGQAFLVVMLDDQLLLEWRRVNMNTLFQLFHLFTWREWPGKTMPPPLCCNSFSNPANPAKAKFTWTQFTNRSPIPSEGDNWLCTSSCSILTVCVLKASFDSRCVALYSWNCVYLIKQQKTLDYLMENLLPLKLMTSLLHTIFIFVASQWGSCLHFYSGPF